MPDDEFPRVLRDIANDRPSRLTLGRTTVVYKSVGWRPVVTAWAITALVLGAGSWVLWAGDRFRPRDVAEVRPRAEYELLRHISRNQDEFPIEERERLYLAGLESTAPHARMHAILAFAADHELDMPRDELHAELAECVRIAEKYGPIQRMGSGALEGDRAAHEVVNECNIVVKHLLDELTRTAARVDHSGDIHLVERLLSHPELEVRKSALRTLEVIPGYVAGAAVRAMVRRDPSLMQSGAAKALFHAAPSDVPYQRLANEISQRYWTADRISGKAGPSIRFDSLSEDELRPHIEYLHPLLDHETVLVRLRAMKALVYGRGPVPDEVTLRYFEECWAATPPHRGPTVESAAEGWITVDERRMLLAEVTMCQLSRARERGGAEVDPARAEHFLLANRTMLNTWVLEYLFRSRDYVPPQGIVHWIQKHDELARHHVAKLLLMRAKAGSTASDLAWLEAVRGRPHGEKLEFGERLMLKELMFAPDKSARWRALEIAGARSVIPHESQLAWFLRSEPQGSGVVDQALDLALLYALKYRTWHDVGLIEKHAASGRNANRAAAAEVLAEIKGYVAPEWLVESLRQGPGELQKAAEKLAVTRGR